MGKESDRYTGFDVIYAEYHQMVFRLAYKYTHSREDAEDITQEVFIRYYICSKVGSVMHKKNWLAVTTRNLALNYMNHTKHERLLWEQETMENLLGVGLDLEEGYFRTFREKERIEYACMILEALKAKKEVWYNVVIFAYYMETPRQDIADGMGMSLNAVMSMLTRVKDWVRKNYKEQFDHIMRE